MSSMNEKAPTAAVLLIGNEVLSGRTKDKNLGFIADYLTALGIDLLEARVVADDAELLASLMPDDYQARPDQAILFTIEAWDANCPQHIPVRFEAADVQRALDAKDAEIAGLKVELARARQAVATPG